ncbi:putative phosphoenolpyruvate synthase-like [Tropilaelaps mercedesae]|uniref:Putative phosphoenolpyruvate synthase-like n=1 Tax=Tropilaelaps mercedesae TaxID=418985 RepID=A0A1V9X0D7_9ACAR|nr:putative phosphoenolpyruvate synthase-like [Tropilaelaps mercedesae]
MVKEGRIPDEDLLFYLTPSEMLELIDTRNPRLIVRAMNRMKNACQAAKDIHPEHVARPPFIPINRKAISGPLSGARSMKGTPVSKGRVIAPARVITRLEDAHLIQKGDVLITYATDIGWSPYFPLISGIVTELGGLISHGAVVAREYGLPSIVGCHGATQMFRSGEEVLLDGNLGVISTTQREPN